jgi:hypothetical protein
MVFLPGGSSNRIRHNKQITYITKNNTTKHSTQNYTHNKGQTARFLERIKSDHGGRAGAV